MAMVNIIYIEGLLVVLVRARYKVLNSIKANIINALFRTINQLAYKNYYTARARA